MRILLPFAIAAFLTPMVGHAEQTSPEGLACFENLATPEFPKTALQAHVDGSVWTYTQATPQGAIDKVETQVVSAWGDGPKLLTPPVEKAIRAAKVKPECAGKTVSVVFRYQLFGEATPNPKIKTRTDGNIMYIESQPESVTEAKSHQK